MGMGWKGRGILVAGLAALCLGCAAPAPAEEKPAAPAGSAAADPAPAAEQPPAVPITGAGGEDFPTFLSKLKTEAAAKGIGTATVASLDGISPIPRVIELDRKQPEFTLTLQQYLDHVVNPTRIAAGRKLMAENRALLAQIGKRYGVQPRFVVAMWGIESDYGRLTGTFPVVDALATLAWDGRRSAYFRGELLDALKILDRGDIKPAAMRGSWAGAMGQCQFMPSTFLKYAEDFNTDGRRDIWTDRGDVLASAANYLAGLGWKGDQGWGREVSLPANFDRHLVGLDTKKTLAQWAKLGVKTAEGKPLPKRGDIQASLVVPEENGPAFVVYDNFRAVMRWNHSTFFALAAGKLADSLAAR